MQEPDTFWILEALISAINLGLPGFVLFVGLKRITRLLMMRSMGQQTLGTVSGVEYEEGWFDNIRHYPVITYTASDGETISVRYYRSTRVFKFQEQVTVYYDAAHPWKYIVFSWKSFVGPVILLVCALALLYVNLPAFLKLIS